MSPSGRSGRLWAVPSDRRWLRGCRRAYRRVSDLLHITLWMKKKKKKTNPIFSDLGQKVGKVCKEVKEVDFFTKVLFCCKTKLYVKLIVAFFAFSSNYVNVT